jgi:hypothetical protein
MNNNDKSDINSVIFTGLNIPVPEQVYSYSNDEQKQIYDYLSQFTEQQRKAYLIAYNHLGSSFNICKSIGFKSWKTNNLYQ